MATTSSAAGEQKKRESSIRATNKMTCTQLKTPKSAPPHRFFFFNGCQAPITTVQHVEHDFSMFFLQKGG